MVLINHIIRSNHNKPYQIINGIEIYGIDFEKGIRYGWPIIYQSILNNLVPYAFTSDMWAKVAIAWFVDIFT
jgi:hypothetical protein